MNTPPSTPSSRIGRNPFRPEGMPPLGPKMFSEPPVPPAWRAGTYGLGTPRPQGAAHRLLFLTPNTPWGHGDPMTPPNTYVSGTNQGNPPMYPDFPPPTSTNPRSLPFTTLTVSPCQYMFDAQNVAYSFPTPTMPTAHFFKGVLSYNAPGGASCQSPTPWTLTLRSRSSHPPGRAAARWTYWT